MVNGEWSREVERQKGKKREEVRRNKEGRREECAHTSSFFHLADKLALNWVESTSTTE